MLMMNYRLIPMTVNDEKKSIYWIPMAFILSLSNHTYGFPASCVSSSWHSKVSTPSTYSSLIACKSASFTSIFASNNIRISSMFSFSMAAINAERFNGSTQLILNSCGLSVKSASILWDFSNDMTQIECSFLCGLKREICWTWITVALRHSHHVPRLTKTFFPLHLKHSRR